VAVTISQDATWPGVTGVESCSGTVGHGTTPGVFVLTCFPQTSAPDAAGDLTIGDGTRRVVFRNCKVESVTGRAGADGQTFVLRILDRRWRWATGAISGRYNQLDRRGKLVPWTIRSPVELAVLCLEAMGERGYQIDLPPGLPAAAGANLDRYLRAGESFPQTLANPPVTWDKTPPAEALARLADYFGCRVVYQPVADRVLVTPLGAGRAALPDGPCEAIAPTIDRPRTPGAVAVAGAPVRIQCRLRLEAVGKEWNGSVVPINDLSYAPRSPGTTQKVEVRTAIDPGTPLTEPLQVVVVWRDAAGAERSATGNGSGSDSVVKVAQVAARLNEAPAAAARYAITAASTTLTIEGKAPGAFDVRVLDPSTGAPSSYWSAVLVRAGAEAGGSWEACPPPSFAGVRPTDRLSYDQALALARESVFKWYRVRFVDAHADVAGITLPWYGKLKRRQQLILEPTKVEQVKPAPRRRGGVQQNPDVPVAGRLAAGGILPEFYNGYSRDQAASVYGSVAVQIGSVSWDGAAAANNGFNTGAEDEVFVGFDVEPVDQLVRFGEYVYRNVKVADTLNTVAAADLTLETSVLVQDAATSELVRWPEALALGGDAPVEWQVREDIQVGVVPLYGLNNKLISFYLADLPDARKRARYYLTGMAKKYGLTGGETRQYIGIRPIDPDGAVQQVSWSVGGGGATTVASTNSEHSAFVPSYPARRRAESLPPEKTAAMANMAEVARTESKIPKAP
jgi:hypothetical protein